MPNTPNRTSQNLADLVSLIEQLGAIIQEWSQSDEDTPKHAIADLAAKKLEEIINDL